MADVQVAKPYAPRTYGRRRRDSTPFSQRSAEELASANEDFDGRGGLDALSDEKDQSHAGDFTKTLPEDRLSLDAYVGASSHSQASNVSKRPRENDDLLARVRAQLRDQETYRTDEEKSSSLSSAPPLPGSSSERRTVSSKVSSPESDADDDEYNPKGARGDKTDRTGPVAGRMKTKSGFRRSRASSGSDDGNQTLPGHPVASSSRYMLSESEAEGPTSSGVEDQAAKGDRQASTHRKQKLAAMVAKRREAVRSSPSLETEFFGKNGDDDASDSIDPIQSSSHNDESDDSLPDPQDLLSMIQGRRATDRRGQKAAGRPQRDGSAKQQKAKGPKQLSKKELEEMHRMTARIERSRPVASLALQSHPVPRQQFDIGQLAAKFNHPLTNGEQHLTGETDDAATSDADDPIENDTPRGKGAKNLLNRQRDCGPPTRLARGQGALDQKGKVMTEEQVLGRKNEDVLRLRKEKWLQNMEGHAQRSALDSLQHGDDADMGDDIVITGAPLGNRSPNVRLGGQLSRHQKPDHVAVLMPGNSSRPTSVDKHASDTDNICSGTLGSKNKQALPRDRHQASSIGSSSDLRSSLLEKIKLQNIQARNAREPHKRTSQSVDTSERPDQVGTKSGPVRGTAETLESIQQRLQRQSESDDIAESRNDDDDDDADSNYEPNDDDEDPPLGSGSEIDNSAHSDVDDEELSGEEILPMSSQNTNRSALSSARKLAGDGDIVPAADDDDEDEDEIEARPQPSKRRAHVIADDEDEVDQKTIAPLSHARSVVAFDAPPGLTQFFQDTQQMSSETSSVPESQQIPLLQVSASLTSLPQKGSLVPSTDSVLGQFFADTQLSETPRGHSLDVIGATGRARNAENGVGFLQSDSHGSFGGALTQFFNEKTQESLSRGQNDATSTEGLMLPPLTIPQDGFAVLRREAQADKDLLASPASLPSPSHDFDQDEEDSLLRESRLRVSANETPRQYLNPQGFFTQTRPMAAPFGSQWTPSQGSSQRVANAEAVHEPSLVRGQSEEVLSEEERDRSPSLQQRKRFRRRLPAEAAFAVRASGDEASGSDSESSVASGPTDPDGPEAGLSGEVAEPESKDAWTALKKGAADAARRLPQVNKSSRILRHSDFIEGEAEESEDEDGDQRGGGLDGVFSDSGSEGEEGDDDEEDDRDLEELVNNEKEIDEAEKDKLARARYQQDLDIDEAAALALAEKAARGGLRNKRRGRGADGGLEDLLDDDFDEERLMRKAINPRAMMAKRRKIEGDGMDLLASKAESQAFVQGYAETHENSVGEEYSYLAPAEADSDSEANSMDESEASDSDNESLDVFGPSKPQEPSRPTVTRQQLAKELREQRRRKRQADLLSDEEDLPTGADLTNAVRLPRDPFASDGSDDERFSVPSFMRDRLAAKKSKAAFSSDHGHKAAAGTSAQYDKGQEEADGDDDAGQWGDDPATAILAGLRRKRASSPRTAARLAKLAEDYKADPMDYTASRRGGGGGGAGSSITSFGASRGRKTKHSASNDASAQRSRNGDGATVTKSTGGMKSGRGILATRNVEESQ